MKRSAGGGGRRRESLGRGEREFGVILYLCLVIELKK